MRAQPTDAERIPGKGFATTSLCRARISEASSCRPFIVDLPVEGKAVIELDGGSMIAASVDGLRRTELKPSAIAFTLLESRRAWKSEGVLSEIQRALPPPDPPQGEGAAPVRSVRRALLAKNATNA